MEIEMKFYVFSESQLRTMLVSSHKVGFLDGWENAECSYPPDSSYADTSEKYADAVIKDINDHEDEA